LPEPVRPTVLLVEDEAEIVGLMRDFLDVEGFDVDAAATAGEARALLAQRAPDCVLLDVMLPGESGFELCRSIRGSSDVPIVFLSARDGDLDKIRGLRLGADDYVAKSATPAEVVERVKAVLRRAHRPGVANRDTITFNDITIDLRAHEVIVAGRRIGLTGREGAILRILVDHPRQVFSRDHLFELVWGDIGDRSAVGVYVRRLREKIERDPRQPEVIVTVWGVGYRFDPPPV
jgi:DNA-binding response OmpR family regulator